MLCHDFPRLLETSAYPYTNNYTNNLNKRHLLSPNVLGERAKDIRQWVGKASKTEQLFWGTSSTDDVEEEEVGGLEFEQMTLAPVFEPVGRYLKLTMNGEPFEVCFLPLVF